jgi:hypothetical protein
VCANASAAFEPEEIGDWSTTESFIGIAILARYAARRRTSGIAGANAGLLRRGRAASFSKAYGTLGSYSVAMKPIAS